MFSGKSSELHRRVKRHQIAKKNCLVLNYISDNRYSFDEVSATHDKQLLKAKKILFLKDVDDIITGYDVVAIDEGQFFLDLLEYVDKWANCGKIVLVAALDATFQRKAFGSVCE